MKKQALYFLFWFMICIGLEEEFFAYTNSGLTGAQFGIAFACVALMGLYLIPAGLLLVNESRKSHIPPRLLWLSLLAGAFISGWLASYGNDFMDTLLKPIQDQNLLDSIIPMTAPFVEEPVKLFAAFFVLYLLKDWQPKQVLLAGATAGLGFQIIEDFAYINQDISESFSYAVSGIFGRMTGAIGSHWLYTALATFGLYLLLSKAIPKTQKKLGWLLLISSFGLHLIWNSPLNFLETPLPLTGPALCAAGLVLFFKAYQTAEELEN